MVELAKREGSTAKVLAVAILTAARSGEVRGMKWAEVDDDNLVWTVPAARMKAGKEHRVPLTPAARRSWAIVANPARWCSRPRTAAPSRCRTWPRWVSCAAWAAAT